MRGLRGWILLSLLVLLATRAPAKGDADGDGGVATVSTTADLGIGTLELPVGFTERWLGTKDSRMGEVRRAEGGLVIRYDIGFLAGLHMSPASGASCRWFRDQPLGDQRAYVGLVEKDGKRILIVSVVPRGDDPGSDHHSTYPANFEAAVANEQDVADVLLIALSFRPAER